MLRSLRFSSAKSWHRSDNLYLEWVSKREKLIGQCVMGNHYLQEQLEKTALEKPDLPCIKTKERIYSYAEINDWSNRRARYFKEFNVGHNDTVQKIINSESSSDDVKHFRNSF